MVVTASAPLLTSVENGTRPPQLTRASITAPLCAMAATPPRRTWRGNGADVGHGAGDEVDDAHAVRPHDRDAGDVGQRGQRCGEVGGRAAGVGEAAAGDDHGAGPDRGRLLGDRLDAGGADEGDDRVRCGVEVGERGDRGDAGDLGVLAVDRDDEPAEAVIGAVALHDLAGERARARADDGDRARAQGGCESGLRRLVGAAGVHAPSVESRRAGG